MRIFSHLYSHIFAPFEKILTICYRRKLSQLSPQLHRIVKGVHSCDLLCFKVNTPTIFRAVGTHNTIITHKSSLRFLTPEVKAETIPRLFPSMESR